MPLQIGGTLPWSAGGSAAGAIAGGKPGQLAANYQQAYNSALGMNQANYNNILKGYQDTLASQQTAFQGIQRGYAKTTNKVMDTLRGSNESNQQQITDLYASQQGSALNNLVSSGLGNSTVTSAVARGLAADESKARTASNNQFAQLQAGYLSQLGQAQLGFRAQAAQANSGLAQNQLQFMNSVQAQYPDAGMYAQLAQQYGMNQQAQRDRAAAMGMGGGGAAPGLGYTPTSPSYYGSGAGATSFGSPGAGNSITGGGFFNPWGGSAGSGFGAGIGGSGFGGSAGYYGQIAGSIANGAANAAASSPIAEAVGQGANAYADMFGSGDNLATLANEYLGGFGF